MRSRSFVVVPIFLFVRFLSQFLTRVCVLPLCRADGTAAAEADTERDELGDMLSINDRAVDRALLRMRRRDRTADIVTVHV